MFDISKINPTYQSCLIFHPNCNYSLHRWISSFFLHYLLITTYTIFLTQSSLIVEDKNTQTITEFQNIQAGEIEVVLQIGESLLKERLPKYFKQDVVLAMSLAYIEMSRDVMALSHPDFIKGSELLERALKLLQEEGVRSLTPDCRHKLMRHWKKSTHGVFLNF